ncbi:MAG: hypothetical protein ABI435_04570 [Pseudolysinimonas sp.]
MTELRIWPRAVLVVAGGLLGIALVSYGDAMISADVGVAQVKVVHVTSVDAPSNSK